MQSINGASLKEHLAAQHCLHGSNSSTTLAEYIAPKLLIYKPERVLNSMFERIAGIRSLVEKELLMVNITEDISWSKQCHGAE